MTTTETAVRLNELVDAAALASLINDPTHPVLILFDVGWHEPARRLEARLIRRSAGGEGLALARVDVGRLPDLAQRYGVRGVPALVLFRSGQVAASRLGEIDDDQLEDWLESELPA